MSGADASHDGKRLAFFRLNGNQIELVTSERNGSAPKVITSAVPGFSYRQPRWSPDDSSIAYIHSRENWADDVYVVPHPKPSRDNITEDGTLIRGLAWTDGAHLVHS